MYVKCIYIHMFVLYINFKYAYTTYVFISYIHVHTVFLAAA